MPINSTLGTRSLRSAEQNLLQVPFARISTRQNRDFSVLGTLSLEPCADDIVSAEPRRSISVGGGGAPPIPKNRRQRRRSEAWRPKTTLFSKIPGKNFVLSSNFLMIFF